MYQFVPPPSHGYGSSSRIGDVNGDGLDDICFVDGSNTGSFNVVRSGADGSVLHQVTFTGALLGLDDVNGDGKSDLLVSDPGATVNGILGAGRVDVLDGGTLAILRSHFGTYQDQLLSAGPVLGDIDGDGKRDYRISGGGIFSAAEWWGKSGATGAQIFYHLPWSPAYGEALTDVGDFNADGFDDIAFVDSGSLGMYHWVRVLAGPSMTQELWGHLSTVSNPTPEWYGPIRGRVGDYDGDGFADVAIHGGLPSLGTGATIISGRDQSSLLASPMHQLILYGELGSPGDANGDGFPDLFIGTANSVQLVSGAPPGVSTIGGGCPSLSGHSPQIGIGIGARLGRTLTVNLRDANPNLTMAFLGGGFSSQQWNGVPLPFDLGMLGLPWCDWRIAADLALPVVTTSNNGLPHHAQFSLPVPANPALVQASVFWQWLVLEPSSSGGPGAVTAAVRTTVLQ